MTDATALPEPPTKATLVRQLLLTDDLPKIDVALKNYASWMMARTSTDFADWTAQEILAATRLLSQTINAHSSSKSSGDGNSGNANADSVIEIWNEIATADDLKTTKNLGRTGLRAVWKDLDLSKLKQGKWEEKGAAYLNIFERFLFASRTEEAALSTSTEEDGEGQLLLDARLIWDADGGKEELARRAAERQRQATQRAKEEVGTAHTTPMIEELPDEEEEGELKSET